MHPGNLLLHATAQVHFATAAGLRDGGRGDISSSFVRGCSSLAEHHEESPSAAATSAAAAAEASTSTAVQRAPLDQQPWLYYRWGAHLFRLPTPTCTCKIIDFGLSSMRVSGARRWLAHHHAHSSLKLPYLSSTLLLTKLVVPLCTSLGP